MDSFKSIVLTGVVAYAMYYKKYYGQIPKFYAKHGGVFSKFLQKHVKTIKESYWPLYYMPSGRYQTILATLLPAPSNNVDYHKEILVSSDGGQFGLAWAGEPATSDTDKVLLISPGLTSATKTNYVQSLILEMTKQGFKCALIVNRGLELPLLTPRAYCATHIMDLTTCVHHIKQKCPEASLYGLGISLGGVILGQYLSSTSDKSCLDAAFICCSPFDTVASSESIEKWDNWLLYGYHLTKSLKGFYEKSQHVFTGVVDHDAVMSSKSIREFDSNFTAKTFGYQNVDQYYQDAKMTETKILSIRIPTLYLLADDDAFVPPESNPYETICKSNYVAMILTSGGGHVAHLQGSSPFDTPYYVTVLTDYLRAIDENHVELKHIDEDESATPPSQTIFPQTAEADCF